MVALIKCRNLILEKYHLEEIHLVSHSLFTFPLQQRFEEFFGVHFQNFNFLEKYFHCCRFFYSNLFNLNVVPRAFKWSFLTINHETSTASFGFLDYEVVFWSKVGGLLVIKWHINIGIFTQYVRWIFSYLSTTKF